MKISSFYEIEVWKFVSSKSSFMLCKHNNCQQSSMWRENVYTQILDANIGLYKPQSKLQAEFGCDWAISGDSQLNDSVAFIFRPI